MRGYAAHSTQHPLVRRSHTCSHTRASNEAKLGSRAMLTVRAVHTFVAEHGDELEFQAGEEIQVIEKDDAFGDGWWRGRNVKGEEGLFPATYIVEDEPPIVPASAVPVPHPDPQPSIDNETSDSPAAREIVAVQEPIRSTTTPPAPSSEANVPLAPVATGDGSLGTTIGEIDQVIETIGQPAAPEDDRDQLGIDQSARARLAAQSRLENEQRDRKRISDGITGLVYSDESDDEEVERRKSQGPLTKEPTANGLQPPLSLSSIAPLGSAPPLSSSSASAGSTPATWTVEEVFAWAVSKGFEDTICQKFKEHEISGDLLLGLDANLLKELDIPQFGKRLRIAQAISELRRPSSASGSLRDMSAPSSAYTNAIAPSTTPPLSTPPTSASTVDVPAVSPWSGRRTSSTIAPSMQAIKEYTPASSVPVSPVTPSSSVNKRESSGSMGHRRNKPSVDAKQDRLSFFGRNRKPAPSAPSPSERISRPISSNKVHQMQPATPERSSNGLGQSMALKQIGKPDHAGYMKKKGDRYGSWKTRYFVLKGSHLYYLRSENEDRAKGHIDLRGYRVIVDENANPGLYGFRLVGPDKPHSFSASEQSTVREWMKALMKATIARDYTVPVTSSCNIPTIPLAEAQAMSPRPPSPATREATQRANRRENTNQLTAHDASVLMSLDNSRRASSGQHRISQNLDVTPSRPSKDMRRPSDVGQVKQEIPNGDSLVQWVNSQLPPQYPRASVLPGSFVSGEVIFLLVRSLSGIEPSPPVPPNAFAAEGDLPGLPGLFAMMDILIDAGIDTAGASINDVRLGDAEAIGRLLETIQAWQGAGTAR